jgi:transcriptional regulator with XRE-family HTH domain
LSNIVRQVPKGPWQGGFAKRLQEALQHARISPDELARRVQRHRSAVFRWLDGYTIPDLEMFSRLCEITGASPAWLLGLSEDAPPKPPRGVDAAGVRQLVREVQRLRVRESEALEKVLAILQRERS